MSDPTAGLDEFDRWMKLAQDTGADPNFRQALVNVHDTLYAAWKSAKTIFREQASPEIALEICRQMMLEHCRIQNRSEQESMDPDEFYNDE